MKYLTTILIALLLCGTTIAQTAVGWRGINRDGVFHETGLLKSWPSNGPELLWSVEGVGKGWSSPVVSSGKLFITGMDEEEKNEMLAAYTLDGNLIYRVKYGVPWHQSYPDTRTTPTVVNDKVYVISGIGEVVCLNAKDGEIIWSVNGHDTFGVLPNVWGVAESPLVFDNKVIFTPGGDKTTMVAIDASTGKTIWTTETLRDSCSFVSPIIINHNGIRQIIGFSENYIYGVNPQTGKMIWKFNDWDFTPEGGMDGIITNTPLYRDGKIFVSNAYGMRSHLLEMNNDATGVKVLWRNDSLSVQTGGMVLVGDVIYGSNYITNSKGDWVTVDWNTGKTLYKEAWEGHSKGSIITADGMLYCYEERQGKIALVRPNPEKFDIVSDFRIKKGAGGHWAHPFIHNGVLYVRHGNVLTAYKVK